MNNKQNLLLPKRVKIGKDCRTINLIEDWYSDTAKKHLIIQEVRISIFTKGSYTQIKKQILSTLLNAEFTVTDRRYLGLDTETGYHGYSIDVQNNYEMED